MLTGCDNFKEYIEISPNVSRIDCKAHTITLTTNDVILGVEPAIYMPDLEIIDSPGVLMFIGNWFKITYEPARPRRIVVDIKENATPTERCLIITASRVMAKDAAFIVQEGRPQE